MGHGYQAVLWNRQKKRYDLLLMGLVIIYLLVFIIGYSIFDPEATEETLIIRSTGSLAFFLLHVILAIGPLSRLDKRFLPILYNRRHLGVTMFIIALVHGVFNILQFHSLSNGNPLVSVFTSNSDYGSLINFPFQTLGFFALLILFFMASTSHDFWLSFLTPKVWKSLHMMVYLAYLLIFFHVALGALQNEQSNMLIVLMSIGLVGLIYLHLRSSSKEASLDKDKSPLQTGDILVGSIDEIEDTMAKVISIDGERVAIFRYEGKLSAVSNVCCHQNGPLGEGKIIDGLITCPWHGYQYQPHDGCAPAPFTEKVATYKLKLEGDQIFLDPKPLPAGTFVEPVKIL